MKTNVKIWADLRFYILLLVTLLLFPVLGGWVGDVAKDYFNGVRLGPADLQLLGTGVILVLIYILVIGRIGRRLIPARVVEQVKTVSHRKVLIALLSPCTVLGEKMRDGKPYWIVGCNPGADITDYGLEKIIAKDTEFRGFTWQQTLRAANAHKGKLEKLVLLGSLGEGGSGSNAQLKLASSFFERYFPNKVVMPGQPVANNGDYSDLWKADFEDLDDVERLIRRVLKEMRKKGYHDNEIIIDATGGFKTSSIAAAMVTLDRPDLMFQYVGTNQHTGRIFGFNVETGAADTGV